MTIKVASGVLWRDDGRVLLLRRAENKHPEWSRVWCPPGGRIEDGELHRAAVRREFSEENSRRWYS